MRELNTGRTFLLSRGFKSFSLNETKELGLTVIIRIIRVMNQFVTITDSVAKMTVLVRLAVTSIA
jgi:hypothetical protein